MKKKWVLINKKADFVAIGKRYNVDPVIAKIVTNRGVDSEEKLDEYFGKGDAVPKPSGAFKDMDLGVEIVGAEIERKSKILVIGDYDADGVCATAILVKTLRTLGAEVFYKIPHRIEDGYGMNEKMVDLASDDGISCIITCDNGISAFAAAKRAKEKGIKLVITDHHNVPFEDSKEGKMEIIPEADAVINPKQSECPYPFKDICGAVVALRFCEKLFAKFGIKPDEKSELYDYAAIATITDVMPLIGENRMLVKNRLNKISRSESLGLRTLCDKRLPGKEVLSGFDIGFVVGPCINATGRVSTADKAVELLLSEDISEASNLADEMTNLNQERKEMTKKGADEALGMLNKMDEDKVLVIYMPSLHESIAGLVAGRVREHTGKPTLVVTNAAEGAKASGRSIEGYSMIDEITKCRDLLTKFGGHPMAAGLSLPIENIDELRKRLNNNCEIPLEELCPKIKIDVPMPFGYVTEKIIEELSVLEPTGKGNEAPVFALKGVKISKASYMGEKKQHLRITAEEEGRRYQLVLFNRANEFIDCIEDKYGKDKAALVFAGKASGVEMLISYRPQINEYMGRRNIQFVIDDFE